MALNICSDLYSYCCWLFLPVALWVMTDLFLLKSTNSLPFHYSPQSSGFLCSWFWHSFRCKLHLFMSSDLSNKEYFQVKIILNTLHLIYSVWVRSCHFSALNPTIVPHLTWGKRQSFYNGLQDLPPSLTVGTSPSNPQLLQHGGFCPRPLDWMSPLPEMSFLRTPTWLTHSFPSSLCLNVTFSKISALRTEFKTATVIKFLKPSNVPHNLPFIYSPPPPMRL